MKKRILNILVIFFIVFISMFANKNVEAESKTCSYTLPMTFIDTSKKQPRNLVFYLSSEYNVKVHNREIIAFNVDCKEGYCYLSYTAQNDDVTGSEESIAVKPRTFRSAAILNTYVGDPGECSDYFLIEFDTGKSNNGELYSGQWKYVNGSQYETKYNTLLNNQYKGSTKTVFTMGKDAKDATTKSEAEQFSGYVDHVGNIILINTDLAEKYKTGKFDKFAEIIKKEKGGEDALTRFPVDTGQNNTRSISNKYYDLTGSSWANFFSSNMKKEHVKNPLYHQMMANWFYYSGRNLLETSPQRFKQIFSYIFEGYINSTDYDLYMSAIDSIINYNNADEKESCFDNPCNVYCTTQAENGSGKCSGTSWDQCVKYDESSKKYTGNQDYGRCQIAYNECQNDMNENCSKYPTNSNAYTECTKNKTSLEQCLKNKLGVEEYNRMKEKEKKQREAIEKEKEDAINKFIYSLSRVSTPSLDINFDNHYELTCDDVSFFHGFYVVLRVVAPIAVIFFGTLDYAKAVIASDVEKMNKSKKNFPKRLLLLLLFIAIPLIISLLLDLFDTDYNLMRCIIKGE